MNIDQLTHTYYPPQITEMAFLNIFWLGQIVIACPQTMHTKFEDEKSFMENCKLWAKTAFILERWSQPELLSTLYSFKICPQFLKSGLFWQYNLVVST